MARLMMNIRKLGITQNRLMLLSNIKRAACAEFGVSLAEIEGRSRVRRIADARQVAMWVSSQTHATQDQIAKCYDRCPSLVAHAVRAVDDRMAVDDEFCRRALAVYRDCPPNTQDHP